MPESDHPVPAEQLDRLAGPQLSRREALAVGGGLAAAAAAGSVVGSGTAAAQTTDPTASPTASPTLDPTASPTATPPSTAVGGTPQSLQSISLEQAKKVLAAAEAAAAALPNASGALGVPMNIVVVDVCGDVKASSRQDGNGRASLGLTPPKAQTALAFRTSTSALAARTTDPVRQQAFFAAGFSLLGGGVPITNAAGDVIGAIGVGGGSPEQDEQVALAGLAGAA